MYKVKISIPQKRAKMISDETFSTVKDAGSFIQLSINRQYEMCSRGWGLVSINETTKGLNKEVIFSPACIVLSKPLRLIFQIIEL